MKIIHLVASTMVLTGAASPATRPGQAPEQVCKSSNQVYRHKAQMPRGAIKALGFPIANAGAKYNATDVVMDGNRKLPFARLIIARRCGSILELDYERGGIAYWRSTALLKRKGSGWTLVHK